MHRTRPFSRGVALLFALLAATTLGGCAAGLLRQGEFSSHQVHQLARQITRNIPKDGDNEGERRFTWVLVIRPKNDPNSAVTAEVLRELRKKYEVFTELDSIPPDRVVRTEHGIEGFKRGFSFKFSITALGRHRVKLQYWSYGASRGAQTYAATYAWVDGDWRPVKRSGHRMG